MPISGIRLRTEEDARTDAAIAAALAEAARSGAKKIDASLLAGVPGAAEALEAGDFQGVRDAINRFRDSGPLDSYRHRGYDALLPLLATHEKTVGLEKKAQQEAQVAEADKSAAERIIPIDERIAKLTADFKNRTASSTDPVSNLDEALEYQKKLKELQKERANIKVEGERVRSKQEAEERAKAREANKAEQSFRAEFDTPIDANTHYVFDNKPKWFNDAMRRNFANTWNELGADKPFPKSPYPTFAEENDFQSLLKHLAPRVISDPGYRQAFADARAGIKGAATTDPWARGENGRSAIDEFRNPYEEDVINNIYSDAERQFNTKMMPKINANFLSRGAFNTGAREGFASKALKDINKEAMKAANEFKFKNHQAAIENERQHRAGKAQHSQSLNEITKQQQLNDILGLETLRTIGQQEFNRDQGILDRRNADFREEQNWPLFKQQRIHEMLQGMPVSSYASQSSPRQAGSSMASDVGNTLGALYMNNLAGGRPQGMFAKGGSVGAGYDDDYVNKLQATIEHMQQPTGNPIYSMMAKMFAGAAASNNPNPFKALAQQTPAGLDAYQDHKNRDDVKQMQILNIMNSISESKHRMRTAEREREEFEFKKQIELAKLRLHEKELSQRGSPGMTAGLLKAMENAQEAALGSKGVEEEGQHMKQAFDTLDRTTGKWTKPGTIYSKLAAREGFMGDVLKNMGYSDEAQAAIQSIEKGRSNLAGKINVASGSPSIPGLQNALNTIPGLGYRKEARDPVVGSIVKDAKRLQDWEAFQRKYIEAKGTNVGAGELFNQLYAPASSHSFDDIPTQGLNKLSDQELDRMIELKLKEQGE